ncbi:hypothetical protein [Methylobacterium iners]|uniref:Uncharacterized protein n=1 Tax=Methylobacterium iners TaxID=418707 RepID=A0ABQ4RUU7_9HYPH|nr:hypothetical protein [Methylobacterium iners]GJD94546.1 hypothetical protein OCOJLMKI_1749 [Methylobacterium iners]
MSEHVSQHWDVLVPRPHLSYRVHFLNPDGRVLRVKTLEASNDSEAIQLTLGLMDGRALDLWHGLRFINSFPDPG